MSGLHAINVAAISVTSPGHLPVLSSKIVHQLISPANVKHYSTKWAAKGLLLKPCPLQNAAGANARQPAPASLFPPQLARVVVVVAIETWKWTRAVEKNNGKRYCTTLPNNFFLLKRQWYRTLIDYLLTVYCFRLWGSTAQSDDWLPAFPIPSHPIPSMCLLAENVHTMKVTMLEKMTMLNGIPNRRGRPSVKTSVLHNTKPKHWYTVYNSTGITNQTINYDLYT